jgi:hypothetical protein
VNHFSSIGFDVDDAASFGRVVGELAQIGEREDGSLGTRLLWSDPSGAAVAVFIRDLSVQCAKPTFAAASPLLVRSARMTPDPRGCAFCPIATVEVLEGEEMAYPLAIELDDIHLGPLRESAEPTRIAVTAFAEGIEVWPDVDAYNEATGTGSAPGHLAAHSLVPSGLFAPEGTERPLRAEAIITGVVTAAERKTNAYSGRAFDWCRLETYAATVDVVAEVQPEAFAAGQVVQGTFWLVGRRLDTTATFRRRRFRRPPRRP